MKAGFGRSDITPRLGVQLAGYGPYRNRAAAAILAPLRARALALESGRRNALLISAELIGFERDLDRRIRGAVAARVRLKPDQIVLVPTHTHSGPAVGGIFGWGEADRVYLETLPARIADAAERAWEALSPVTWRGGEGVLEGFAINRETDEGYAAHADFWGRLDPRWRPGKPKETDSKVRVLAAFGTSGACKGIIHQFACHPVVCGEQTHDVHGDYAGLASADWEADHPGAVALYLPGAFGDINPCLNHRNPSESRRAVRLLARRYQKAVANTVERAIPLTDQASLRAVRSEAVFTRKRTQVQVIRGEIRSTERSLSGPGVDDRTAVGTPPLGTRGMRCAKLQGLRAIEAGFSKGRAPNPAVALVGLRIGSVFLLGCGLEVFHRVGQAIRGQLAGSQAWIVSLVGGMGYAPDARARRRGGYAQTFIPYVLGEIPFEAVDRDLPEAMVRLHRQLR